MPQRYEIYVDEAWTHGGEPKHRYWCFYGGIFGTESDLSRLDTRLRACLHTNLINGEVKWQRLQQGNLKAYTAFVDCLLDAVESGEVKFRQMLCSRANVRVPELGETPSTDLDVQFKLCYQFIKHCFGLKFLPQDDIHEVLVRFDTHSSQKHKNNLVNYVTDLPTVWPNQSVDVKVTFEQSEQQPRIQVVDLMIGASGSWGNKMHLLRQPGKRGMTPKQRARHDLCKHIYDRLRQIDSSSRGSMAFNWFETTGKDGDQANLLNHKIRVWQFVPRRYQIDAGWQNDHLDNQGRYQGEVLLPEIHSVDDYLGDLTY